jgi:glycosyltransferase involved in cell wall biosynthesis
MLGKLSVRGMVAAVDAARIVAVPSLWPEPFGLVGIESQARGRPVAAYAIGGIPEWIGDAGLAVAPGDEGALAQAMDALLDERHWASRSQAALRHARAFTPAAHVARLQPLLFERAVRYIA